MLRSGQRKAFTGDRRCGIVLQEFAAGVVEAGTEGAHEGIAGNLNFKRQFAAAHEFVGRAVSGNFHPFPADAVAVRDPDTFAIAVAGARIAGIGIRLLHGAIGVEDVHVLMEGRACVFNKPGSDDGVRGRARAVCLATTEKAACPKQENERSSDGFQTRSLAA